MKLSGVIAMARRRVLIGLLVLVCLVLASSTTGSQFEYPPLGGTTSGESLDFGSVSVGRTGRASYTFKVLESSDTSAQVTISSPSSPFALTDLSSYSLTLAPGQSITFTVTFTPPQAREYSGQFTITASGGYPVQVRTTTVSLRGRGVAPSTPPPTEFPPTPTAPVPTEPGPSVTGTTDEAGDFTIPLELTTTVAGRLTQCGKIPLGSQPFTLTSTADGFLVVAPGYQPVLVADYSTFSLFGLRSVGLGTICLLPEEPIELPPVTRPPDIVEEVEKKPDYAFAESPCVDFAPAGSADAFCHRDERLYPQGERKVGVSPVSLPLDCSVLVKARVVNQGEKPAGPPVVQLTVDGLTADLQLVAIPPTDRVPQYWKIEMVLPKTIALNGDRLPTLQAVIDPLNVVEELSEANNTWEGAAVGAFELFGDPSIVEPEKPDDQPSFLAVKPDGTWVVALDKPLRLVAEAKLPTSAICAIPTPGPSGVSTVECVTYAPLDLKYHWDFGDGETDDRKRTSHTYRQNGTYTLTVQTTLGETPTTSTRQPVEVSDKPVITDLSPLLRRVFVGGVTVHNTFTAYVEPNGNTLESVQFVLNGEPKVGQLIGTTAFYTRNVGDLRLWPDTNTLYAIAYARKPSGEPVVSDPYPIPPLLIPVAPVPSWLAWMSPLSARVRGGAVDYTSSFAFPNIPIDVSVQIPDWVPLVNGTYSFEAGSRFALSLSSLGPGRVSGEGNAGFEKSGGDWSFSISGSAEGAGALNIGPPITLSSGEFSVELDGSVSKTFDLCDAFPPLRAACRIPIIGRGVQWLCRRGELGLGLSLGVGGGISFASADPGCCLRGIDCQGTVSLSGGLQASLTLSVSIASITAFGGGTLTATFSAPGTDLGFLDFDSLTLAGEVGVTIEVDLWLVSASKTFSFPFECQILSPAEGFATHTESPWTFPERPYATPTFSTFRGEIEEDEDLRTTGLWVIEEVFPQASPKLARVGEQLTLAWNTDDLEKPFPLGREIVFAAGPTLSSIGPPRAVTDNLLPDAQVALGADESGTLVAVWVQHVSPPPAPTSEEDLTSNLLAGLEIVWAGYDPQRDRWSEPVRLTENAIPDHSPLLVRNAAGLVGVLWGANRRGELFPTDLAPDTILFAAWNGRTFDLPAVVREDDVGHARTAVQVGNDVLYVWAEDNDGDPTTAGDAELWYKVTGAAPPAASGQLTDDAVDDVNPVLIALDAERALLLWVRGGQDGESDLVARAFGPAGWTGESTVMERFNAPTFEAVQTSDGRAAVIWEGWSDQGPDLFVAVYDPTTDTTFEPRQLTADPDTEAQLSATHDGRALTVAYVRTMVEDSTSTFRYTGPDTGDPSKMYEDREVEITAPSPGAPQLWLLECSLP